MAMRPGPGRLPRRDQDQEGPGLLFVAALAPRPRDPDIPASWGPVAA